MILVVLFAIDLLVCLLLFWSSRSSNLGLIMSVSLLTLALSGYNIFTLYQKKISLSSVLLLYTIAVQFGLIVPYYYIGGDVTNVYSDWTLAFLSSKFLGKAVLLGDMAVISYELSRLYVKLQSSKIRRLSKNQIGVSGDTSHLVTMAKVSLYGLLITLLYFLFYIIRGRISLSGTYEEFMESPLYSDPIYHYILVLFYFSTISLSASGSIKDRWLGWAIWGVIALIFALTGNKGEFMYPLLAVIGVRGVLGQKISVKLVLFIGIILFLVIPTITTLRGQGIASNISNASASLYSSFVEMGMQLRTSVYTLENLHSGTFEFLNGRSYWQPIVNILTPFSEHEFATTKMRQEFGGFGYNQVIESYLNLGVLGVLIYFSLVGGLLCKYERKLRNIELGYLGVITCILINASRNYFAFVPGQILMASFFYWFMKYIVKSRTKKRLPSKIFSIDKK